MALVLLTSKVGFSLPHDDDRIALISNAQNGFLQQFFAVKNVVRRSQLHFNGA